MLTLFEFKLEACSPCQNDCELCAHADLMRHIKGYQLSLESLDRFLFYTERSNYFIRLLAIHGPGDPFLWRHLNEGLKMIKRSRAIGWVNMVTNGLTLDRISDDAMECLDRLHISLYENYNRYDLLKEFKKKHGKKVRLINGVQFWEHRTSPDTLAAIPAGCSCDGPMLFDDKIFLHCGPPVFGAAKAKGVSVDSLKHMYVPLGLNYMESYNRKLIGSMDICRYCWANTNFQGRYKVNDTRNPLPKKSSETPSFEELVAIG